MQKPQAKTRSSPSLIFWFVILSLSFVGCSGANSGGSLMMPQSPQQPSATSSPSGLDVREATLTEADAAAAASATGLQVHEMKLSSSGVSPMTTIAYPGQLTFHGGAQLVSTVQHAIYLNCPDGSCWGGAQAPTQFLNNFANSTMIHQVDEYIGVATNARYPVGATVAVGETLFENVLHMNDMLRYIHVTAVFLATNNLCSPCTGYGHEYHVFLPQGIDVCNDFGGCYSPDHVSTFSFCAEHGSIDFPDIGHVIFSVEPYQAVQLCQLNGTTPNGTLIDSTSTALSHEIFESITDPDPQKVPAWYNPNTGDEVADECRPFLVVVHLGAQDYEIQQEYSNNYKACLSP